MQDTTHLLSAIAVTATLTAGPFAADLKVTVRKERNGGILSTGKRILHRHADGKSAPGPNKSPALSWSKGPTRHTLLCADNDRP